MEQLDDQRSILSLIDRSAVSEAAKRESRNREVHLPPLSVFRWWARRTGAVNDAVLNAATEVLGGSPLMVLDPFAGGGTIPLVALRAGHRVHAQDLNPWATRGISQMLRLPPPDAIAKGFECVREASEQLVAREYGTHMEDGRPATVAHTYRVAVGPCGSCGQSQRLFPYSLLTLKFRKERKRPEAVLACRCGHVFDGRTDETPSCPACDRSVEPLALYTPRREVECVECGGRERLSERAGRAGWGWEVVMVERVSGRDREFGLPTDQELDCANRSHATSLPLGAIPQGSDTSVLLRHGFRMWADLYPYRQRFVTERLLEFISESTDDPDVAASLRMAVIGTTEFAGHLSRWDRFYLKCNDATAGHRFNFSTFVPEPNVWGVGSVGRGTFARRVRSMQKASAWLEASLGRRPVVVEGAARTIGPVDAVVVTGDSAAIDAPDDSFDLVLTDPPYHDDVQYGELSLLFRAWAGLPMDALAGEALTNRTTGVNAHHDSYASVLTPIFTECRRVLRPTGRLIFSYANREPEPWLALFHALQESGFQAVACTVVHSENETDFKKRDVRSCNEDLLLELSPSALERGTVGLDDEADDPFLAALARLFLSVGTFEGEWRDGALNELRAAAAGSLAFSVRGKAVT